MKIKAVTLKISIEGKLYSQELAPNNGTTFTKKDVNNAEKWVTNFNRRGMKATYTYTYNPTED